MLLTIGAGTSLFEHTLFGLFDNQGFETSVVYERTAARWITILK